MVSKDALPVGPREISGEPGEPSADLSCHEDIKRIMNKTLKNLINAGVAFDLAAKAYEAIGFISAATFAYKAKDAAVNNAALYKTAFDAFNVDGATEKLRDANTAAATLTFASTIFANDDDLVGSNNNDIVRDAASSTVDVVFDAASSVDVNLHIAAAAAAADADAYNTFNEGPNNVYNAAVAAAADRYDEASVSFQNDLSFAAAAAANIAASRAATMYDAAATYQATALVVDNAASSMFDPTSSDVLGAYKETVRTYAAAGKVAASASKAFEDLDGIFRGGTKGKLAAEAGELAAAYDKDRSILKGFQKIVTTCQSSESD